MKKVMILGAGRGQIPLMNFCHKYGAYVIAVSPKGNYPGFKVCDEFFYEDIKNKEAILTKAQSLSIDAIITDQLDQSVPSVAYVAEKMGLPGISYNVALKFSDKFNMRSAAKEIGINVPESCLIKRVEDAIDAIKKQHLKFPLIMKPVDGSASNGVFKVDSVDEIAKHLDNTLKFSKSRTAILEQFIDGNEYVVEAYTHNYVVHNLMVGHRDYFDVPGCFIPSATVFQDSEHVESELEQQLKSVNETIVKGFGLKFGITHGEFLVEKKSGKIYLVEIAARGGGVFISSEIIPAATGVNANELLVKDALGIYDDQIAIKKGAAAYFCYLLHEGEIVKIDGCEAVEQTKGVRKAFFDNIEVGMHIDSITDKSSRKGPIIVEGNCKTDCYNIIEDIRPILQIETEKNGEIQGIVWN